MARRPRPNIPRPTFAFVVSTPTSTAATAPQITTHTLRQGLLDHIEVEIPPGHVGITGIAFQLGNRQIFPLNEGEFFRGDDIPLVIPVLMNLPPSGEIDVRTFNEDTVYAHVHLVRYYLDLEPEAAPVLIQPIPVAELETVG